MVPLLYSDASTMLLACEAGPSTASAALVAMENGGQKC
jgi:hypothetical protein